MYYTLEIYFLVIVDKEKEAYKLISEEYEDCTNNIDIGSFIENTRKSIADMYHVEISDVRNISKEDFLKCEPDEDFKVSVNNEN